MQTDRQNAMTWLPPRPTSTVGRGVLRRCLIAMAIGNLVREILQLPLYTIWRTARPAYLAYAVLHCWISDLAGLDHQSRWFAHDRSRHRRAVGPPPGAEAAR